MKKCRRRPRRLAKRQIKETGTPLPETLSLTPGLCCCFQKQHANTLFNHLFFVVGTY